MGNKLQYKNLMKNRRKKAIIVHAHSQAPLSASIRHTEQGLALPPSPSSLAINHSIGRQCLLLLHLSQ